MDRCTGATRSKGGGCLPSSGNNGGIGDIKDQIVLPRKEELQEEQRKESMPDATNSETGVKES